jgi:hypothetical protein
VGHAVAIKGGLKLSPSLLKTIATPQVPRGVIERSPINVDFFVNIERSDPTHSMLTRTIIEECAQHVLADQNVAVYITPARLAFVSDLALHRIRPAELRRYNIK